MIIHEVGRDTATGIPAQYPYGTVDEGTDVSLMALAPLARNKTRHAVAANTPVGWDPPITQGIGIGVGLVGPASLAGKSPKLLFLLLGFVVGLFVGLIIYPDRPQRKGLGE